MVSVFKERNILHIPVLLILAIVLKLKFLGNGEKFTFFKSNTEGILPQWLLKNNFFHGNTGMVQVSSFIAIFVSAILANWVFTSGKLSLKNNMLGGLSFILLTSLFPATNLMSSALLTLPLIIILYAQILKLYNLSKPNGTIINIGLLMGSLYLLYHPLIWLLPCCIIGLSIMRPFRLNEWFLLIFSILTPAYFLLTYEFFTGNWQPERHLLHFQFSKIAYPSRVWVASLSIAVLWCIIGIGSWLGFTRRMLIQSRKNWYVLTIFGILLLPTVLLPSQSISEGIYFICFPASAFASYSFMSDKKKLVQNIIFWLLVGFILFLGWYYS